MEGIGGERERERERERVTQPAWQKYGRNSEVYKQREMEQGGTKLRCVPGEGVWLELFLSWRGRAL